MVRCRKSGWSSLPDFLSFHRASPIAPFIATLPSLCSTLLPPITSLTESPPPTVPVPALRPSSSPRLLCLCPSPIHADLAQLHPPPAPLTHPPCGCLLLSPLLPRIPCTAANPHSCPSDFPHLASPCVPSPSAAGHPPSASRQPFPAAARRLPPRSPPGPPLPSPPAVVRTLRRILHPTAIIHSNRFAPAPRRPRCQDSSAR